MHACQLLGQFQIVQRVGTLVFGQDRLKHTALPHRFHRHTGLRRGEQLFQLFPDAFTGDLGQPLTLSLTGGEAICINPRTIPGIEPKKAQNPQIIFAQTLVRIANKDNPSC